MKKFVLALVFAGCAALNGQVLYNGPTDGAPALGYEARVTQDPCGPYLQGRCQRDHGFGYVTNPGIYPIRVTVDCDDLYTFYPNMVVPPRTTQKFLIDKSATRCWIRDIETLVP